MVFGPPATQAMCGQQRIRERFQWIPLGAVNIGRWSILFCGTIIESYKIYGN